MLGYTPSECNPLFDAREILVRELGRHDSGRLFPCLTFYHVFCKAVLEARGFHPHFLMRHQDLPEWLPKATDSESIPYRKERLMALGNAVVPQVSAIAWKRLAQIAEIET